MAMNLEVKCKVSHRKLWRFIGVKVQVGHTRNWLFYFIGRKRLYKFQVDL